jgi:hypothetical protein
MSITVLILLQLADAALTLAHSIEELKGRLADYFGAIVGVRISAWIGVVFFFAVLTAMLWLVAAIGIAGSSIWPNCFTIAMLALLVGCRVSDGLFSHVASREGIPAEPGIEDDAAVFHRGGAAVSNFSESSLQLSCFSDRWISLWGSGVLSDPSGSSPLWPQPLARSRPVASRNTTS